MMTCPLKMTALYYIKIFKIKTFANCPKTAKCAKVFSCEIFSLYGRSFQWEMRKSLGETNAPPPLPLKETL